MSSSLFSSFQENTKCESRFFADTCTRCVPIFWACNCNSNWFQKVSNFSQYRCVLIWIIYNILKIYHKLVFSNERTVWNSPCGLRGISSHCRFLMCDSVSILAIMFPYWLYLHSHVTVRHTFSGSLSSYRCRSTPQLDRTVLEIWESNCRIIHRGTKNITCMKLCITWGIKNLF